MTDNPATNKCVGPSKISSFVRDEQHCSIATLQLRTLKSYQHFKGTFQKLHVLLKIMFYRPFHKYNMPPMFVFIILCIWWIKTSAECKNGCSGHGRCTVFDMCICHRNWQSNDCSESNSQIQLLVNESH